MTASPVAANTSQKRWLILALAVVAMVCIANLQYGWTLFVNPLSTAHGWKKSEIQSAFTAFVLAQVWVVPFNGWFADRYGPKPMVALAGIAIAVGWYIDAHAGTISRLVLGEIVSGIGAGLVYGTMVGVAVKWFPEGRGLAVGQLVEERDHVSEVLRSYLGDEGGVGHISGKVDDLDCFLLTRWSSVG